MATDLFNIGFNGMGTASKYKDQ
ncbi:hypothetical protein YPPY60_1890, partial [Yersinia pestis PY-60]